MNGTELPMKQEIMLGILFIVPVFTSISGALCQHHPRVPRVRAGGGGEQFIGPVSDPRSGLLTPRLLEG